MEQRPAYYRDENSKRKLKTLTIISKSYYMIQKINDSTKVVNLKSSSILHCIEGVIKKKFVNRNRKNF